VGVNFYPNLLLLAITQACEDFAATIIIGEMGYTKCRDSKYINGFYVSGTDFLQFHICHFLIIILERSLPRHSYL
jgi:hypothetical protein